MKSDLLTPIIFFLTLEDKLPQTFYKFDREFKKMGCVLVPVRIDQLQALLASTEQTQLIVLSSVTTAYEYRLFNERIRGLLKFVLKSKRISFLQLSSFSKLNDTKQFAIRKNYFFQRYPINVKDFAGKVVRYHHLKTEANLRWPGGRRATIPGMAA